MKKYLENNYNIFLDIDETLTFDEGITFVKEGISFIKENSNKVNFNQFAGEYYPNWEKIKDKIKE